jgi:hypothetical protein
MNRIARCGALVRAAGVILLGVSLAAAAASLTVGEGQAVNRDRHGVAIDGYDPVAYFVDDKPVRGLTEFEHSWNGARYRFATAANRDRFASSPESFAPQYGGSAPGLSAAATRPTSIRRHGRSWTASCT